MYLFVTIQKVEFKRRKNKIIDESVKEEEKKESHISKRSKSNITGQKQKIRRNIKKCIAEQEANKVNIPIENPLPINPTPPTMDLDKKFIALLLSPATPFIKKKQLITEYYYIYNRPIPKGIQMIECNIIRDKTGLKHKIYPRYELIYSTAKEFILASQKMNALTSAHYNITMDRTSMKKESPGYLGKLRAYKSGTEYNIYSDGDNPKDTQIPECVRDKLGSIEYVNYGVLQSNIMGKTTIRKMSVLIPKVKEDGSIAMWKPMKESDELLTQFRNGYQDNIIWLLSREPSWSDEYQSYYLKFDKRPAVPSIKNFQLVDPNDSIL